MPSLIQEAASRGGRRNLSGGPATTDAGIKKTASRPSPTRTRTSRVVGDHAKRPSPYPHLVSSLDKEGETRRGGRPNAAGKREGRHQQTTRRAVPDDQVRVGNVEGRGGMACTATTRRRPRLIIDRKLGRALEQPITTSSATCWRRASRSRMAFPVDIACALGMRVVSIQSEAGGRLGQGNRHDVLWAKHKYETVKGIVTPTHPCILYRQSRTRRPMVGHGLFTAARCASEAHGHGVRGNWESSKL